MIQSQPSVPPYVQALAVDGHGLIYLGQPTSGPKDTTGEVAGFNTDTLLASQGNVIPVGAGSLAFDGSGTSARVYLLNFDFDSSLLGPS